MMWNQPAERLFGREAETQRLLEAIQKRESLLISGAGGAGKSALLHEVIRGTPARIQARCIWIEGANGRKEILRQLVGALCRRGDGVVGDRSGYGPADEAKIQRWLARQTSRRLGGLAAQALRETEYWLFLDHSPPATHAVARLLADFMRLCKTPIYLAARGHSQREIGRAWKLYWNPERRLELKTLSDAAARQLLEYCWEANGLGATAMSESGRDILRASEKLPGAIRAFCGLASDPRFHGGGQIKTRLLRTEYLISAESKPGGTFAKESASRRRP